VRYRLHFLDQSIGGCKTSPAKKAAARRNGKLGGRWGKVGPSGKLGGRPRGSVKRTLGEFLMRRKLKDSDYRWVERGILPLTDAGSGRGARSPRYQFEKFFGVTIPLGMAANYLKTTDYKQKHAKPGTPISKIIREFRRAARKAQKAGW
jgi:hypothetical protein